MGDISKGVATHSSPAKKCARRADLRKLKGHRLNFIDRKIFLHEPVFFPFLLFRKLTEKTTIFLKHRIKIGSWHYCRCCLWYCTLSVSTLIITGFFILLFKHLWLMSLIISISQEEPKHRETSLLSLGKDCRQSSILLVRSRSGELHSFGKE